MSRRPVQGGLRLKAYPVLQRAVEEGFRYGWGRAHKYTETPTQAHLEDAVTTAILNEICEYFEFDPSDEEEA
jgi:hypothetical protein